LRAALHRFSRAVGCAIVLRAGSVRAEPSDATPARVHVDAPEECASDASVWRATSRRTDRLVATTDESAVLLEFVVRPDRTGANGELSIVRDGKRGAPRKVHGASCDEVTQALSLMAALAFDPAARIEVPEDPPSEAVPPPSTSAPAPQPPPPVPDRTASPNAPPTRWRFGGGVYGGPLALNAPRVEVAYGAFVALERQGTVIASSFRAGVMRAAGHVTASGIDADLGWTLARVSLCPVHVGIASTLSFRPCAGADAGTMSAHAQRLAHTTDRTRAWVAPTAAARLTWMPASIAFVEVGAELAVPLVRDALAVDPSVSLYRAPMLVPSGQAGAGLLFP
jgi:hypothetical protein